MTREEFRELVRIKLAEANLPQYVTKITDIIGEVYTKGLADGFDIGTKIK